MVKLNIKNFYDWPATTRRLIVGLLCIVVFYFAYTWDIDAIKSTLANKKNKESDLKKELELVVKKEITISNGLTQYKDLVNLLINWQKKFVQYSDLPELLNMILKIGSLNHVYFALFTPGEQAQDNYYYKVPIRIIALGSYHQLANFISQVANMSWIVVISDFNISTEAKNDVLGPKLAAHATEQNLLTAEINLNIYRLPTPPEIIEELEKKAALKKKEAETPTPNANSTSKQP